MNYKDATFVEKYIEKIVLLIALAIVLVVAYILFAPESESIAKKAAEIKDAANKVAIESEASSLPKGVESERYFDNAGEFKTRLRRQLGKAMDSQFDLTMNLNVKQHVPDGFYKSYVVPTLPGASDVKIVSEIYDFNTQSQVAQWMQGRPLRLPTDALANEPLEDIAILSAEMGKQWLDAIRANEPNPKMRHMPVISIAAKINKHKIAKAYRAVDLPAKFTLGRDVVVGVVLERQMAGRVKGHWGEIEIVKQLPYQSFLMEKLGAVDDRKLQRVLDFVHQSEQSNSFVELPPVSTSSRQVVDPATVETRIYSVSERKDMDDIQKKMDKKNRDIDKLQKKIDKVLEKEEEKRAKDEDGEGAARRAERERKNEERKNRKTRGGGGEGGIGGGLGGLGGGGRIRTTRDRGGNTRLQKDQAKVSRLQEELGKLEEQLDRIKNPIEKKETGSGDGGLEEIELEKDPEEERLNLAKTVDLMAHDISMAPGKRYRYRVRVAILNPLYHRAKVNAEQREENFNKLYLLTEPSEWTAPVYVYPVRTFFVKQASMTDSSASVEVFRLHHGRYYMESFRVEPGENIGNVKTVKSITSEDKKVMVDFSVGSVSVDTVLTDKVSSLVFTDDGTDGALEIRKRKSGGDEDYLVLLNRLAEDKKGLDSGSGGGRRRAPGGLGLPGGYGPGIGGFGPGGAGGFRPSGR